MKLVLSLALAALLVAAPAAAQTAEAKPPATAKKAPAKPADDKAKKEAKKKDDTKTAEKKPAPKADKSSDKKKVVDAKAPKGKDTKPAADAVPTDAATPVDATATPVDAVAVAADAPPPPKETPTPPVTAPAAIDATGPASAPVPPPVDVAPVAVEAPPPPTPPEVPAAPPSAPVTGERQLVAVLDLKASEGAGPQASALTTMLTAEVSAQDGLRAVSRNELQALISHQSMAQLVGCDEPRCMADVAHLANASFVVSGSVEKLEGATVIGLTLIDAGDNESGEATIVGRQKAAWRGSDDELLLVVRPLVQRLFDSAQAHTHKGSVEVFVPEGATVFLNDAEVGQAPVKRLGDLPTGVHSLLIKKDGYSDGNVDLVVARNETTIVRVDLEPIPLTDQPWFWAAAGGVVLLAGGTAAGITTYAILNQETPSRVVLGKQP